MAFCDHLYSYAFIGCILNLKWNYGLHYPPSPLCINRLCSPLVTLPLHVLDAFPYLTTGEATPYGALEKDATPHPLPPPPEPAAVTHTIHSVDDAVADRSVAIPDKEPQRYERQVHSGNAMYISSIARRTSTFRASHVQFKYNGRCTKTNTKNEIHFKYNERQI